MPRRIPLANGGIHPNASAGTLTAAAARAGTSAYNPNQKLPYSSSTGRAGVQHSFAKDYVLEVRYVGVHAGYTYHTDSSSTRHPLLLRTATSDHYTSESRPGGSESTAT